MSEISYSVSNMEAYPWNGKHQCVNWDLPIKVVKGVDTFMYYDSKGEERWYNKRARDTSPIDQRWVAYVDSNFRMITIDWEDFDRLLKKVVHKDLTKVLTHCIRVYKKALRQEIEFLKKPLQTELVDESPDEDPIVTKYKV